MNLCPYGIPAPQAAALPTLPQHWPRQILLLETYFNDEHLAKQLRQSLGCTHHTRFKHWLHLQLELPANAQPEAVVALRWLSSCHFCGRLRMSSWSGLCFGPVTHSCRRHLGEWTSECKLSLSLSLHPLLLSSSNKFSKINLHQYSLYHCFQRIHRSEQMSWSGAALVLGTLVVGTDNANLCSNPVA